MGGCGRGGGGGVSVDGGCGWEVGVVLVDGGLRLRDGGDVVVDGGVGGALW